MFFLPNTEPILKIFLLFFLCSIAFFLNVHFWIVTVCKSSSTCCKIWNSIKWKMSIQIFFVTLYYIACNWKIAGRPITLICDVVLSNMVKHLVKRMCFVICKCKRNRSLRDTLYPPLLFPKWSICAEKTEMTDIYLKWYQIYIYFLLISKMISTIVTIS